MHARKAAVAALVGLCAQAAQAEVPAFKPGDLELGFSGGLSQQSTEVRAEVSGPDLVLVDEDATVLLLTFNPGYFLTQRHQVGILSGLQWYDSDSSGSDWSALAGASYTYNLPQPGSTMVPTVGAFARMIMFDAISDYAIGVNAGVRVLAGESISVNWQLYYEYLRADDQMGAFDLVEEDTAIGVRVGFSWILRRDPGR